MYGGRTATTRPNDLWCYNFGKKKKTKKIKKFIFFFLQKIRVGDWLKRKTLMDQEGEVEGLGH